MIYYGIKPESLGQLGSIGKQIQNSKDNSVFIKVKFLRPYGVAYLDQVMEQVCEERPSLRLASTYGELNQYLKQCGFNRLAHGCELFREFPQQDNHPDSEVSRRFSSRRNESCTVDKG